MSTDMGPLSTGQPLPPPPPCYNTGDGEGRARRSRRRAVLASSAVAAILAAAGLTYELGGNNATANGTTSSATLSTAQLEAKVDPDLVDVVSKIDYGTSEELGTGIVLTSSGLVLTNNHVVEGATSTQVTDVGNGKTYTATVLGYDLTYDVAVLQLKDASGLKTATLGNSSSAAVGEGVLALGNAGGKGGTPSPATGTITALGQSISAYDEATGSSEQLTGLIETDANIQSGDSGGSLVNASGDVIGMDTAASSSFQFQGFGNSGTNGTGATQGFAIPINEALSIAKQIEAGHASTNVHIGASAFLGVEIGTASSFVSPGFGEGETGAAIEGVLSGTPAATAGLSAGDTITSVGDHAVSSATDLRSILTLFHPGEKVSVTWVNEFGTSQTATLTLSSGPVG